MTQPKKFLESIERVGSEEFDRTAFLRLDKNEYTGEIPDSILNEIKEQITSDFLTTYPQLFDFYHELSKFLHIPKEQILITAGSDAGIKNIFEVFVHEGDEVIFPEPTYAMYRVYSQLFQAVSKPVPYSSTLTLSVDDLIQHISSKTVLITLANPNSPTGTIISKEDIIRIIQAGNQNGAIVLIDEAYHLFYPESVIDLIDQYSNLFIIRTFSKAFGLASARLGYVISQTENIKNLKVFRPIYEISGFASLCGQVLLNHYSEVDLWAKDIIKNRDEFISKLTSQGIFCYPSAANFVNVKVGKEKVGPIMSFMEKNGILLKAGSYHPALCNCIRVTIGPSDQMYKVTEMIVDFVKNN